MQLEARGHVLSEICRTSSQCPLRNGELLDGVGKHSTPPNPRRPANPGDRESHVTALRQLRSICRFGLWPGVNVCNSGHSLSRDHAHLLRSLRSLQNARSCSGRRNSQTPGAHYRYLCFYLTKDSQGRQA